MDILSHLGIGVSDDAVVNLEKNQISDFNDKFWSIPASSTVMAVMDNNQADFGTKTFNPMKDAHHVDCLNVLQVIKPAGNNQLGKDSKAFDDLDANFIASNCFEKSAGDSFSQCFNSLLLSINDIQPSSSLVSPELKDIIPIGDSSSNLASSLTAKFIEDDGNILKSRLLEKEKYIPFNFKDPSDPDISWKNLSGSKTSLRFLKIGKSTDDHVFLESLEFLYDSFKTTEREKIFLTLDQALHFKYKSLISQKKMPKKFIDFFIAVLDPFHYQWCLQKCVYSSFENAGLKDLLGILGIDCQKWPNLLGDCKNVHKAQALLLDITVSLGIFFVNYLLGTMSEQERQEFDSKGVTQRSIWLQSVLPPFLERLSSIDRSLSVYVEFYKFLVLVIQCWESQRISDYDMYMNSIRESLPYLFAFNRYNYQQSAVEFLADISLLGEYYVDLLRSGIMFESMSGQPGKDVSCGYVLEIYNKIIKQITSNIDSTGTAWLRNLPRLGFIHQLLINASKAGVFSSPESDPISKKIKINRKN